MYFVTIIRSSFGGKLLQFDIILGMFTLMKYARILNNNTASADFLKALI